MTRPITKREAVENLVAVCDDIVKYGELDTSGGSGMHRDLVEALRVFRALKRSPVLSGTAKASAEKEESDDR